MLLTSAQTLQLWISKPGQLPPPLCGAIPAESSHVAKVHRLLVISFFFINLIWFDWDFHLFLRADFKMPISKITGNPSKNPSSILENVLKNPSKSWNILKNPEKSFKIIQNYWKSFQKSFKILKNSFKIEKCSQESFEIIHNDWESFQKSFKIFKKSI